MLKVRNLEAGYSGLRVLKGLSLHVFPGEIVAIIGANGAGKSTLLNTVAGLVRPSAGSVIMKGTDIAGARPERILAAGCSLVPEGRKLFAPMTVRENLELGGYSIRRRYGGRFGGAMGRHESEADIASVYELFPLLKERSRQLAGTLSGGEQQMLAIGRSLMARPELIMLDEPSMGLAPLVIKSIFSAIRSLSERGKTILVIEQNAKAILKIADRGYVMETGSIVLEGTGGELLANKDVQRAYLGKEYSSIADEREGT
jgi:branched-chain amino acid transport system ATP-binding protein